jgi:hypothetical protein
MPCDDCSRTEKCPPCPEGEDKPLFAPGAEEYYRKVLGLEPKCSEPEEPRCACGPDEACGSCPEMLPEEPPMTPEEEEQAPEDAERCTCGETACESELCDCDSAPCPVDHASEAPKGENACADCLRGVHGPNDHRKAPPQPDRRPPYAVAYSVQGHLYEVALPGDATVQAIDGALIIQHDMAPVAGIVQIRPLTKEN